MIQEKKCKGHGKAKSVNGCGKLINVNFRKYGLCTSCYADFILNTDYGRLLLHNATIKAKEPRLALEQAQDTRNKQNAIKSILINLRMQLHGYIRERDKGKLCISCNSQWTHEFQAGHFYKSELYSSLKFDKDNIHGQCKKCNLFLEGNEGGYRLGLIRRYGQGFVEILDKKAAKYKKDSFKWDIEDLKKTLKMVQKLKKKLK